MIRFLQSNNRAAKYLLAGFLLIICASMVTYLIPGIGSGVALERSGVVATVAGEDIRTDDVNRVVQNQMRQQRVSPEMAAFYAQFITKQVVQQMIQRLEVKYAAHKMGLKVTDEELRDEMQNGQLKQYLFPNGQWIGQDKYEELLKENGTTVEEFEKSTREGMLTRKFFSAISGSAAVSPAEIEQAYKEKNLKVKFQYAVLNLDDISKTIKPTDAELNAFFATNKARYANSIPEKRQVRYFQLSDKSAESNVTVDASDIQRYYSSHAEQYKVPERVRARHILITMPKAGPDGKVDPKAVDEAKAKAQDIMKQAKAPGANFAELANKYSQDPGNKDAKGEGRGGELGWFGHGAMVAEFDKAAFALSPGQVSDVVQTPFGFHVIQLEEKEAAKTKSVSDVKAEIEPIVKAEKVSALLSKNANDAQDLASKQGIEKAAAKYGAQIVQSNPVARNDALPGVGAAPEVMTSIFGSTEKSGPQVARYPQGFVVFEVTKVVPARTPSLDEIKDKVTADFKSERAGELFRRKTQELADRAHTEHDLAKAAKEVGATVKTSELVDRLAAVPDLGNMGGPASAAFNLKKGEISGPLNLGQKGAVLEVVERVEPSTSDPAFARDRDELRDQLSEKKREEALQLYLSSLGTRMEKEGKVKINQAEMNNLSKGRG
jgi:peptidyl-prolyl cis-trans isomerase D